MDVDGAVLFSEFRPTALVADVSFLEVFNRSIFWPLENRKALEDDYPDYDEDNEGL